MDLHGVLTTLVGQESKDQVANPAFVARVLMKIVPEPFLHHPQVPRDVAKLDASRSEFVEDPTYEVLRKIKWFMDFTSGPSISTKSKCEAFNKASTTPSCPAAFSYQVQ